MTVTVSASATLAPMVVESSLRVQGVSASATLAGMVPSVQIRSQWLRASTVMSPMTPNVLLETPSVARGQGRTDEREALLQFEAMELLDTSSTNTIDPTDDGPFEFVLVNGDGFLDDDSGIIAVSTDGSTGDSGKGPVRIYGRAAGLDGLTLTVEKVSTNCTTGTTPKSWAIYTLQGPARLLPPTFLTGLEITAPTSTTIRIGPGSILAASGKKNLNLKTAITKDVTAVFAKGSGNGAQVLSPNLAGTIVGNSGTGTAFLTDLSDGSASVTTTGTLTYDNGDCRVMTGVANDTHLTVSPGGPSGSHTYQRGGWPTSAYDVTGSEKIIFDVILASEDGSGDIDVESAIRILDADSVDRQSGWSEDRVIGTFEYDNGVISAIHQPLRNVSCEIVECSSLTATTASIGSLMVASIEAGSVSTTGDAIIGGQVNASGQIFSLLETGGFAVAVYDADSGFKVTLSNEYLIADSYIGLKNATGSKKTLELTGDAAVIGSNTGDQNLSGLVPTSRTVNGHALSANVTVTLSDVGAASQSDMETATSTTVAVAPGVQHFHPAHPKAVGSWTVTGTAVTGSVNSVNATTDVVTWSTNHGLTTGQQIRGIGTVPAGWAVAQAYYVNALTLPTFALYLTLADAKADTNRVNITATTTGATIVKYVLSGDAPKTSGYGLDTACPVGMNTGTTTLGLEFNLSPSLSGTVALAEAAASNFFDAAGTTQRLVWIQPFPTSIASNLIKFSGLVGFTPTAVVATGTLVNQGTSAFQASVKVWADL